MSRLAVVADPRECARLAAALDERGHHVEARYRTAADLVDLVAGGAATGLDAVLAAATRHCLTAELIAACDAAGLRVVAVAAGTHGHRLAARLGLYEVVEAGAGTDELERMLAPAPASVRSGGPALPSCEAGDRGAVIAVWGPTGAPGRSTLSASLAAEFAAAGRATALGDVDPYGGSIATALGLLDEAPGFAAACRLAGGGALTLAELDRVATVYVGRPGTIRVLTGIGRPSRWTELSEERVRAVVDRCRDWVPITVLDTGFGIESDEELSSDVAAPRRNAATLAALHAADRVVVVGGADPVGLSRLVRAVSDLREEAPMVDPVVVVNRVRSSVAGPAAAHQVRSTLERFAGVAPAALIPDDRPGFDRALATGQALPDAAPRSPARVAIRRLATALLPDTSTEPVGRPDRVRGRRAGRRRKDAVRPEAAID